MTTAPAAPPALPTSIDADRVLTITLEPNQGPMCILDEALIRRIEVTLKDLPRHGPLTGMILASGSPRVFVAGADLKSIVALSIEELDRYLAFGQRVFGMLCSVPCPTVAAINGAALGGGLELAMHCDALVAAPAPANPAGEIKPYPVGLPEAGLQICPGWGGTNLLPARIKDVADAVRRTASGKTWMLNEAHAAGLFDAVAPDAASLQSTAKQWIRSHPNVHTWRRDGAPMRWIGRGATRNATTDACVELRSTLKAEPARSCLLAIEAGLEHGWNAALKVERERLNHLRNTPEGKAAIQAFFDKSAKK